MRDRTATRPDFRLLLPSAVDCYAGPRLAAWILAHYEVSGPRAA